MIVTNVVIPDDLKKRWPKLMQLMVETESMDDEERNYWIGVLPTMSEEQVEKLRGILVNEKSELSKLDEEYAQIEAKEQAEKDAYMEKGAYFSNKINDIQKAEEEHEESEKDLEAEILSSLEDL